MLVIFGFSSLQGSMLPSAAGDFAPVAHFVEYAVLAVLMLFAAAPRRLTLTLALALLVACSLYGASDEFHQRFVSGRTPDVADWVMDTVGAGVAIAATALVRRRGDQRQ
jgi:VanZ family protein